MHRALLAAGNVKYMSIGAPPSESQHSAASCNGETEHFIFLFTVIGDGNMRETICPKIAMQMDSFTRFV